ncbi:hypothetical protein [Limosilactobacillus caviae]|uniref:hypothetical protein n=1 Tax=Limosilactobacillus caviae TaxID=1769424 RepID=UPI001E383795|nr:hypothetical protein [Limosilactobacillus caviae]MCD7123306.1 hypothetical protein [Limosilactobacillus caviae]
MSKVAGFYQKGEVPFSYYLGKKRRLYKKIKKRLKRDQQDQYALKTLPQKLKVFPIGHPLRYEGAKHRGKYYRLLTEGGMEEMIIFFVDNFHKPKEIKEIRFRPKGSNQEISLDDLVVKEENMRRY